MNILLVDPDSSAAVGALVEAGYRITRANSFEEAILQLPVENWHLVITKARLGAFNGLHLVLRCRATHPDVPAIVVGALADRTADIAHFGAQFAATPLEPVSFLELVDALLSGRTPPDRAQQRQ